MIGHHAQLSILLITSHPFFYRVQFEDVHRLSDGQVKHSSEVFYAGSLWKVFEYKLIVLFNIRFTYVVMLFRFPISMLSDRLGFLFQFIG